jgi:hypothetical protein
MKNGTLKGILAIVFFLILASHWINKGEKASQGGAKTSQRDSDSGVGICESNPIMIGCNPNSNK